MTTELARAEERNGAIVAAGMVADEYARVGVFADYWQGLSTNAQATRRAGLGAWRTYLRTVTARQPDSRKKGMRPMSDLETQIEAAWEARDTVTPASSDVRAVVEQALELLDSGKARVAEKVGGEWQVNQWLKKAVLLSFRLNDNGVMEYGAAGAPAFDKVPLKFTGWDDARFREAGVRVVPGAVSYTHLTLPTSDLV